MAGFCWLKLFPVEMAAAITAGGGDAIAKVQEVISSFHRALPEATGSPRLRSMLDTIIDIPAPVRSFHLYTSVELEQRLYHHRDLALAVALSTGQTTDHHR